VSPAAVRVEARAKLNLGLWIGPRRADRFHDLVTVFQSVSLADTLIAERRRSGFSLEVKTETAAVRGRPVLGRVPAGPSNLVLRAAHAFVERTGLTGGARFRLIKRIPSGSGMGGGSADAAATLVALRALYRPGLDRKELLEMAAALGADVPFALHGGTAIGTGRGEHLTEVSADREFRAVIAIPRWRIATRDAYAAFDRLKNGLTGWRSNLRSAQRIAREGIITIERALSLGNSFEMTLGTRRDSFESLRSRLLDAGARHARLTGSGSAVFGVLEAGVPVKSVVARFRGPEAIYLVHSTRAGVRLRARQDPGRW
jgi:4-diphosphocytidyl-2-C-methyl-D-erythritol kinase